ncbi:hypothetical protein A2276_08325 [candidate division WOR-1 bacterium RIFOXYA12_FULL_43_27]|uniref:Outer membrane protein beta-barrel domain-containing protein n=1 Tax=candidate division WOR-1 bacterium RIFOXYC2_FULL_46_14 TaxID=1802587 RepID=A0A1F4U6I9_UNCSA|nr:MAG: hypothetical protein A2276_08325 [candidate division WOR-1 bacterium RIFOXYA12_FULL_43_27]OGC20599.1 MAG: hypothetical protein A2292_06150 [candidate division WOR-1 bacterium RIFOXYB2_FULL_46_45]OGC31664.1 MAG: hypothetical protein A2232_05300 [candidate division WOR-1 bacterium RIFOXYA2_FULL_46_56]OGC40440.1 MAG: hypothetical protein A2438_04180 [candidate division WOR-1 bacterium RIFOXYC2_FULL_46_14]
MKKLVVLLFAVAFVVCIINVGNAATPNQVRAYISTLENKLGVATRANDHTRVLKLNQMIADQKVRLQAMETVPQAVAPAPMKAAPSTGLFGWGLNTDLAVNYVMDKSIVGLRADLLLPDPLGLGGIIGLQKEAVGYKLGLGYFTGNDTKDVAFRGIPIYLDGVIMFPMGMYLQGGINYLVNRSGSKSGSIGGQVYVGVAGDIGLGSKSFAQIGYSILRTGDSATPRSSKGFDIGIGQMITL